MIEMQVGAQHCIDARGRKSRRGKILEEGRVEVAEDGIFALAIPTNAGIDHHVLATGAQRERLEGNLHQALGRREVRLQPIVLADVASGLILEQHRDVVLEGVHFDDAGYLDIADSPVSDRLRGHGIDPMSCSCQPPTPAAVSGRSTPRGAGIPRIMSAAFSAIITTAAFVLPLTTWG